MSGGVEKDYWKFNNIEFTQQEIQELKQFLKNIPTASVDNNIYNDDTHFISFILCPICGERCRLNLMSQNHVLWRCPNCTQIQSR